MFGPCTDSVDLPDPLKHLEYLDDTFFADLSAPSGSIYEVLNQFPFCATTSHEYGDLTPLEAAWFDPKPGDALSYFHPMDWSLSSPNPIHVNSAQPTIRGGLEFAEPTHVCKDYDLSSEHHLDAQSTLASNSGKPEPMVTDDLKD